MKLLIMFFFYIVIAFFIRKGKVVVTCILEGFFAILCMVLTKDVIHKPVDFSFICLYAMVGFLLGGQLTKLTYLLVNRTCPRMIISFSISWDTLIDVVIEEMVWRFPLVIFSKSENEFNPVEMVVFYALVTVLFVMAHNNVRTVKEAMEMYLFSLILLGAAFWEPGLNVGLHLGRNVSCQKTIEEHDGRSYRSKS